MKHCALRRGRHSQDGQTYLITFGTDARRPLFGDTRLAMAACRAIHDPRLWRHARLLAWVLMPDHWHGLVELDDETLARAVQRLKANVSRHANLHRGGSRPVWASAYHDRALRREEEMVVIARYIVANPVRAGLVKRVGDYPFWDAVWLQDRL